MLPHRSIETKGIQECSPKSSLSRQWLPNKLSPPNHHNLNHFCLNPKAQMKNSSSPHHVICTPTDHIPKYCIQVHRVKSEENSSLSIAPHELRRATSGLLLRNEPTPNSKKLHNEKRKTTTPLHSQLLKGCTEGLLAVFAGRGGLRYASGVVFGNEKRLCGRLRRNPERM